MSQPCRASQPCALRLGCQPRFFQPDLPSSPMSFRKRNVALGTARTGDDPVSAPAKTQLPGVRPSPVDGRHVTSTGASTLDGLLAGHGGLALGCSLLIEENGTTDYAGALLKFFAAEGLLQGQHVHVIGMPEQWGRGLPGVAGETGKHERPSETSDKMKIAWRYESLGQHGGTSVSRGGRKSLYLSDHNISSSYRSILSFVRTNSIIGNQRAPPIASSEPNATDKPTPFSHTFDLTKRLVHPASSQITFYPFNPNTRPTESPFTTLSSKLKSSLAASPPSMVHRLIIPSLLSPAIYPPHAPQPQHLLPFLHSLRCLLSTHHFTILISLPRSLHPRSAGLTRFIEILHDGVLELSPFPHSSIPLLQPTNSSTTSPEDRDPPQGLLRIHKLPILHERGSGNAGYEEDWTFTLSRRTLTVKPFNLPPVEGDREAQEEASVGASGTGEGAKGKKSDVEF